MSCALTDFVAMSGISSRLTMRGGSRLGVTTAGLGGPPPTAADVAFRGGDDSPAPDVCSRPPLNLNWICPECSASASPSSCSHSPSSLADRIPSVKSQSASSKYLEHKETV